MDSSGSAYVVGVTTSPDFPATKGAFQETYTGAANMGFLAKLNPAGTGITYATFLGGPGNDSANAVALDGTGNIYITGSTMGFDQLLLGFFTHYRSLVSFFLIRFRYRGFSSPEAEQLTS